MHMSTCVDVYLQDLDSGYEPADHSMRGPHYALFTHILARLGSLATGRRTTEMPQSLLLVLQDANMHLIAINVRFILIS